MYRRPAFIFIKVTGKAGDFSKPIYEPLKNYFDKGIPLDIEATGVWDGKLSLSKRSGQESCIRCNIDFAPED